MSNKPQRSRQRGARRARPTGGAMRPRSSIPSPAPARGSRRPVVIAGGVALIAVVAVALWLLRRDGGTKGNPVLTNVQRISVASRNHVESAVAYAQTPPVGGDHAPVWQNCGFYSAPIRNENGVHSLEHGAVWITYRPDVPAAEVEMLRARAKSQTYILVSPFPNLSAPVVASAWGLQLRLESAGDPQLQDFIRAYRQGPQTPEPGATCSGGIGAPQ